MIRIKICGVKTVADAELAYDTGADAVGLNFYPRSPRFLDSVKAREIADKLPSGLGAIGVFVESSSQPINSLAASLRLAGVQTYREPPFDEHFAAGHIPAFRVHSAQDLASISTYLLACRHPPAAILVDSHSEQLGGSGIAAPWQLLAGFDPGVPLILAGGLTPENVAEAIRIVRPHGVDVASGVEASPGVKDPGKVREFVAVARAAFSCL